MINEHDKYVIHTLHANTTVEQRWKIMTNNKKKASPINLPNLGDGRSIKNAIKEYEIIS